MKKVAAVFSLVILSLQMTGQAPSMMSLPVYKNCTSCHRPEAVHLSHAFVRFNSAMDDQYSSRITE